MQKMLTLDNLYQFFVEQGKSFDFNSRNGDMPIAVQVPSVFEIADDDMRGMLVCKVKTCHTDLNRNQSFISKESMEKAMPTLKYRPVLAYIHQLDDGTYDFYSHNFEITQDEDGNAKRVYQEAQVGAFMDIEPVFEESDDKTYVVAYAAIPEEYTEAANIIRRKNGTKVSAELVIDEMSYNAKEKYLELKDFYFGGVTLLGCNTDGEEIQEGMAGSRLDIADFQCKTDDYKIQDRLLEILNRLDTALLSFNKLDSEKGGLDAVVEEKETVVVEEETPVVAEEEVIIESDVITEEESTEAEVEAERFIQINEDGDVHISYDISHEELRSALYQLLAGFEDGYWIVSTHDKYVIVQSASNGWFYRQNYLETDTVITLDGEMERVYAEFLTPDEKTQIDTMREEYVALKQFKADYDAAQEKASKDAIFGRKCYDEIRESDDFKNLIEHATEYAVEDIEVKCDLMFAAYAKSVQYKEDDDTKEQSVVLNFAQTESKPAAYAGLFD